jgi:RNA polymerase sigma factor (sigma-70 family)
MARIAVNKAIDFKRKQQRTKVELLETYDHLPDPEDPGNIETALIIKEKRKLVLRRMNQLPENYRRVINSYYMEEKSYKEIASEQGVEAKTIETKLYRARKWIQRHWKEDDF